MNRDILGQIERASPSICRCWDELLRSEPVDSSFANPDAMAKHIPESITDLLETLGGPFSHRLSLRARRQRPLPNDCGHNPYRAYFAAGEQAMTRALVPAPADAHTNAADDTAVAGVIAIMRLLARPKIDAFCGVCGRYRLVANCRFATCG